MVISSRAQVKGLGFDRSWDIVHCKRIKERTCVQIQIDFDFGRKWGSSYIFPGVVNVVLGKIIS